MSLNYQIRSAKAWPEGWYPGTITSIEEKPGKFDGPVVQISLRLRRAGGEEREFRAFCSVPTSTQSKGYVWYLSVIGKEPPAGTCPLGDLLGRDVEALLEIVRGDDRENNRVASLRRPAPAEQAEELFDVFDVAGNEDL